MAKDGDICTMITTDKTGNHHDVHTKIAEHEVSIKGFNTRMDSIEHKVDKGFDDINDKLDSLNISTRPDTGKMLGIIGGAVALVFTAGQIILSLTVSPLRTSDEQTAASIAAEHKTIVELAIQGAKTHQVAIFNTEQHADIVSHNNEHIATLERHTKEMHQAEIKFMTTWQTYQSKYIAENKADIDMLRERTVRNETNSANLRKWINDVDFGKSRGWIGKPPPSQ